MPTCVVKWCGRSGRPPMGFTFHSFPKNPVLRKKWREAVRIERGDEDWTEDSNSRICSLHFRDDDFVFPTEEANRKRLLSRIAVPVCTMSAAFYPLDSNVSSKGKITATLMSNSDDNKDTTTEESPPATLIKQENLLQCATCKKSFKPSKTVRLILEAPVKAIVINVSRYLSLEYKILKKSLSEIADVITLDSLRKRTAEATGLTQRCVKMILAEQKRREKRNKNVYKLPPMNPKYIIIDRRKNTRLPDFEIDNMSDNQEPEYQLEQPSTVDTKKSSCIQTDPDIASMTVEFGDINANHIITSNESPPVPVNQVSVIMSEEDFYNNMNQTEPIEEIQPVMTTEPLYCSMDPMDAMISQPNIMETQPIVTTDQLYCGLPDPNIPSNAIAIPQPLPMNVQSLMPVEAAYMPVDPQSMMQMEPQQYMQMDPRLMRMADPRYMVGNMEPTMVRTVTITDLERSPMMVNEEIYRGSQPEINNFRYTSGMDFLPEFTPRYVPEYASAPNYYVVTHIT